MSPTGIKFGMTPAPPPPGFKGVFTNTPAPGNPNFGAPSSTAGGVSGSETPATPAFSKDDVVDILRLATSTKQSNHLQVNVKPRVGGIDGSGVWVGQGALKQGAIPKGVNCYRGFKTDVVKNLTALIPIEKFCVSGLKSNPLHHFCTQHESSAGNVVSVIRAMEKFMISTGMDGVFNIIQLDGNSINMFQEPGLFTHSMVETWCGDLLNRGVIDQNNPSFRHDVCPFDTVNMTWAGEALLNSCSDTLLDDIQDKLGDDMYGPLVLSAILFKVYRPSYSTVEAKRSELRALKLTDFPGEDVSRYCQAATKIIREIWMNFMQRNQIPTLTSDALKGLTCASDNYLRNMIASLCIESDVNGFGYSSTSDGSNMDVTMILAKVESCWKVLCNQGIYGPALQIKAQAKSSAFTAAVNQAVQSELHKLEQNRGAKSSIGVNSGATPQTGNCFDCGQMGHHRGDPSCPKPKGQSKGHGLDAASTKRINLLGKKKLKEYTDISTVPDGLEIMENGKLVAKFCSKCRFFTKGLTMHSSATHGENSLFPFPSSTPSGTSTQPQANLSTTTTTPMPPVMIPTVPPIAAHMGRHVAFGGLMASTCHPIAELELPAPVVSFRHHLPTNYDFGSTDIFHDTVLAADTDGSDSDDSESSLIGLLGVLGKGYGR
jgi:hypothetical protein